MPCTGSLDFSLRNLRLLITKFLPCLSSAPETPEASLYEFTEPEPYGLKIEIQPYDPAWPTQFESIKSDLASDLALVHARYLSIEHVGSTAIPGLQAKPEIDIAIVISDPFDYEKIKEGLIWGERQGGYTPLAAGGGVEGRWSFKLYGIYPQRNVYVVIEHSMNVRGYRDLKRTLIADAELRAKYGRKKMELAERIWPRGVMEYAIAKNGIVREILEKSGWSEKDIDEKERGVRLLREEDDEAFRGY